MRLDHFTAAPLAKLKPGTVENMKWIGISLSPPCHFQDFFEESEAVALRTSFSLSEGKRHFLVIPYCFYTSRAFLNTKFLGTRRGFLYPHIYELTNQLKKQNSLLLEVLCAKEKKLHAKSQVLGVFSHWDCKQSPLQPAGIGGVVQIVSKPTALLRRCLFIPEKKQKGYRLKLEVSLDSLTSGKGKLLLTIVPRNFRGRSYGWEKPMFFPAGLSHHTFRLCVQDAVEWFPYEIGHPSLYTISLTLVTPDGQDQVQRSFGFRQVQINYNKLLFNGIPLYLRGSNLAPLSFHLGKVKESDYTRILNTAKEANLNVLRVHAHVEKTFFYDQADRAGLLLFQDFPLQWGYEKAITQEAQAQIRKMFVRLHTHPSIFLFCCHNEPFILPSTDPEHASPTAIATLLSSTFLYNYNKDILDRKLERALRRFQPSQIVLRASGLYATPFHAPTDAHIYCGWYLLQKEHLPLFLYLFPYFQKFITEFGAQAFPNLETLKEWQADKLSFAQLQKDYLLQPSLMKKYVSTEGKTIAEIIEASQKYQAEVIRYYIEFYRLKKYHPNLGFIHFVLNDGCPGITWSVIDCEGRSKQGLSALRQASEPLHPILKHKIKRGVLQGQWIIAYDHPTFLRDVKGIMHIQTGSRQKKNTYLFDLQPDSLTPLPPFAVRLTSTPLTISFSLWHNGNVRSKNTLMFGGSHATT